MGCSSKSDPEPKKISLAMPVSKTNDMQVYMHYMPWFQSKEVSGYWGQHWRMNTRNPEIIDTDGKRQIASKYYPLIGPYDSNDKDVIEYHLLLMKYAGIDVVLIDWYGSSAVTEYQVILNASNALIDQVFYAGLKFGIVYEEYTAEKAGKQSGQTPIQAAQSDISYLEKNYYTSENYVIVNKRPLLLTFGPRFFKTGTDWTQIFANANPQPIFLPLWFHASLVGAKANGEFGWVDFTSDLSDLNKFYTQNASGTKIGSAFPRYDDYYVEGGWGQSYGHIDANGTQTLSNTLQKAVDNGIKHIQLVTWNDFGEGTVIEPTQEDQFTFLKAIQQFTGVQYGEAELTLIYNYYLKKKKYALDQEALKKLKEAFNHLVALEPDQAKDIIEKLP
jgi:glycoprotein endo-alpha-1,2-mannosidase